MTYGLLAALGWGTADLLTAITARRIGTFATLVIGQVVGTVLAAVYLAAARPDVGGAGPAVWLALLAGGVFAGIAYFGLYRGLELGPIALVSPIVAADAAVAIILFVAFLHESLSPAALVGVVVTVGGVVLASADPRSLRSGMRSSSKGIPFALLALGFFSLAVFVAGYYAKSLGWFLPMFASRLGTLAVLAGVAGTTRAKNLRTRIPGRFVWIAVVIGLVDILGFAAYTRGSQLGLVSIVTAASAVFPLLPVLGGIVLFKERPAVSQGLGVAFVVGGLVVLGLAR